MGNKVLDALGDEIIIGNSYGYSQSSNGLQTATVGVVKKVNPDNNNVSLKPTSKRGGVWGDNEKRTDLPIHVTVQGGKLFPVHKK